MSRSASAVLEDALQLPSDERELVALSLLESLGKSPPDDDLDETWSEEAHRRLSEWRAGAAVARPWDEVGAALRAKLRGS